jgi:hypothetical protein
MENCASFIPEPSHSGYGDRKRVTADDSQRVIRGTLGTISMLAPYDSRLASSMMRSKLDTLTIQYRDDHGGLHGMVFTMSVGMSSRQRRRRSVLSIWLNTRNQPERAALFQSEEAIHDAFSKTSRLPFGMQKRHLHFHEGGMWSMALLSR